MENTNKKIIFLIPDENTSFVQIISGILEKNGIQNINDDLLEKEDDSKWMTVIKTIKDLFDKKITEEKMTELLQNELKVSKESATAITKELKEKIIPFGKKINIPDDDKPYQPQNIDPASFKFIKNDLTDVSGTPIITTAPVEKKSTVPVSPRPRIKKPIETEEVKKFPPTTQQPNTSPPSNQGPDAYREPIE